MFIRKEYEKNNISVRPILLEGNRKDSVPSFLKNEYQVNFTDHIKYKKKITELIDSLRISSQRHPLDFKKTNLQLVSPGDLGITVEKNHVVIRQNKLPSLYLKNYFKIADDKKLIGKASRINADAFFSKSEWSQSVRKKYKRNKSYFEKNPYSMMLISDRKILSKYIGISHIIPLTQESYNIYASGCTKDNSFPDDLVCSKDQTPSNLLIFTLAIDHKRLRKLAQLGEICSYGSRKYLLIASLYHILQIMNFHNLSTVDVCTQAGCSELFKNNIINYGFTNYLNDANEPVKTGDNFELFHNRITII